MSDSSRKSVPVHLEFQSQVDSEHELSGFLCLRCESNLDINQPEAEVPERLLGVCGDCGSWYLIEIDPENESDIIVARIPDAQELRKAIESANAKPNSKSSKPNR
jgi:hypothetical protein